MTTKEYMNGREVGSFFIGVFVTFLAVVAFKCSGRHEQPPTLGGQTLPAQMFQIDFAKRYNISTGGYEARGEQSYDNVKILGFVGSPERASPGMGSYSTYDYFGKWLVLELVDARKVYLPVSAIAVIEEVNQSDQMR